MVATLSLLAGTGIIFIILSFIVNREASARAQDVNRSLASLLRVLGINLLLFGGAFAFFDRDGWSYENTQKFKLIISLVFGISMILTGLRYFMANGNSNGNGKAKMASLVWMILWTVLSVYGFMKFTEKNNQWTTEAYDIVLTNAGLKVDGKCYLEEVKKVCKTPEDFSKLSDKKRQEIREKCESCSEEYEKKNTEVVEGLPDDF